MTIVALMRLKDPDAVNYKLQDLDEEFIDSLVDLDGEYTNGLLDLLRAMLSTDPDNRKLYRGKQIKWRRLVLGFILRVSLDYVFQCNTVRDSNPEIIQHTRRVLTTSFSRNHG
jgi:hypothetical protein